MRSTKNIVFIVVVALVILAQVYYSFTTYKQDLEVIANNKAEIAKTQAKIDDLEEKLARLEESKKELAKLEIEKTALLDTIPNQAVYSQFTSNFFNYLTMIDFGTMEIVDKGAKTIDNDLGRIYQRDYEIKYISTYSDSKKLLEEINSMYQAANIRDYAFDASIQSGESDETLAYKLHYGDRFHEVGNTTFNFSVFYRMEEGIPDEVYQPAFSEFVNATDPFNNETKILNPGSIAEGGSNLPEDKPVTAPIVQPNVLLDAPYTLFVGDILNSGDTYKLSGPGEGDEGYVGLVSKANTQIRIAVYEDHYELSMEDENGQVKQTNVTIKANSPALRIISTMRPLEAVMPNVHVYVYNYTKTAMPISIEGSMLDNIHIYNEKDQEVRPGESKGNIVLLNE